MGRKIERPKAGAECRYVPKAFDNDKDEDPVVVFYKQPTEGEKRRLMSASADETVFEMYARVVEQFVDKVTNYGIADVTIDDGKKLAEYGETAILNECATEVLRVQGLEEEEAKK